MKFLRFGNTNHSHSAIFIFQGAQDNRFTQILVEYSALMGYNRFWQDRLCPSPQCSNKDNTVIIPCCCGGMQDSLKYFCLSRVAFFIAHSYSAQIDSLIMPLLDNYRVTTFWGPVRTSSRLSRLPFSTLKSSYIIGIALISNIILEIAKIIRGISIKRIFWTLTKMANQLAPLNG